ncbi:hypothetical protein [Methylobacterium sp. WL19]|uniref:hypothetical protein n=1 Tax=Methylobacterium sp. WL19 TaxID=2603896 RepID=UPI0011C6F436|nr:hypothetical protein [Methylobacterium sp. WL19]TXN27395.1 hypothetical protein FV220_11575 [Methylobacterium sp. WL19]
MSDLPEAQIRRESIVRIRLPEEKFNKLTQVSNQNGLSNSDYLRVVIFAHLAKIFPEETNNGT